MMFVVKRVKGGATHYAAATSDRGHIERWTPIREKAEVVLAGRVESIKAFHAGKDNVGTLTYEPVPEPKVKPATVIEKKVVDDAPPG